jgi:hypothetical protein
LQLNYKDQESLLQYLLGSLPPVERTALEERLLTDNDFYEELLIAEDELIDQYCRDEQSPTDRQLFETHFLLTPERQQKVRFARSFKTYLNRANEAEANASSREEPSSVNDGKLERRNAKSKGWFFPTLGQKPILAYSLAAAFILVIALVSWIALDRSKNPALQDGGKVLAVVLTPGLTRDGGEIKKISIPPGTATVTLQLEVPKADYTSYRAELLTTERTIIATNEGLHVETVSDKAVVAMPITRSLIERDDYYVGLAGKRADGSYENVASYVFRVLN